MTIKYESEFIPFEEAASLFRSKDDLLNALKDGNITASGNYYDDPEQKMPRDRSLIPSWCWHNLEFNGTGLLGALDEFGSDVIAYDDITIEKTGIDKLKKFESKGRGRKAKFEWEKFFMAVAFHLYMAALDEDDYYAPNSVEDWAKNAMEDFKYVWENTGNSKAPGRTTLKDKLRPLYKAIEKKSDEPLKKYFINT